MLFNLCEGDFNNIFNYADDNSLLSIDATVDSVMFNLRCSAEVMISWFEDNHMQANPAKFQLLRLGDAFYTSGLEIGEHHIESSHSVKILGVTFERTLSFRSNVDEIFLLTCRQTTRCTGASV